MTDLKVGEPFGLDAKELAKIDWALALKRTTQDLRTDFIYAPHLAYIYAKSGAELVSVVQKELQSGVFSPGLPITIEVPKTFRIRVAAPSKRLGPNYSRPGSILLPKDRVFYQALADHAGPVIGAATDVSRSFSHILAEAGASSMFLPTRVCWNRLQTALSEYADHPKAHYILKIDIANFFGSLNQHTLINVLNDVGYSKALSRRLESMLISFTGDRSSRGILQGIFPSDLLGNFYLSPVDQFLDDQGVRSARYVDDLYIFLESVDAADQLMRQLIPMLRRYDLVLNEAKSVIMPASALMSEEPDLENLLEAAVEEVRSQIDDEDFDADYGFQSDWDEDDEESEEGEKLDEDALALDATIVLFDSISEYPGHEENIERFCLPLFARSDSDYAVPHVIDAFKKRPAMSQIYAAYLGRFIERSDVATFLVSTLNDVSLMDWQKMWTIAALLQANSAGKDAIKACATVVNDASRHDALRATAAIFVGRFGNHTRRTQLFALYGSVSQYVQAAIYFSSRQWPGVEKNNARASWGSHGVLNVLLTKAMAKK